MAVIGNGNGEEDHVSIPNARCNYCQQEYCTNLVSAEQHLLTCPDLPEEFWPLFGRVSDEPQEKDSHWRNFQRCIFDPEYITCAQCQEVIKDRMPFSHFIRKKLHGDCSQFVQFTQALENDKSLTPEQRTTKLYTKLKPIFNDPKQAQCAYCDTKLRCIESLHQSAYHLYKCGNSAPNVREAAFEYRPKFTERPEWKPHVEARSWPYFRYLNVRCKHCGHEFGAKDQNTIQRHLIGCPKLPVEYYQKFYRDNPKSLKPSPGEEWIHVDRTGCGQGWVKCRYCNTRYSIGYEKKHRIRIHMFNCAKCVSAPERRDDLVKLAMRELSRQQARTGGLEDGNADDEGGNIDDDMDDDEENEGN